MAKSDCFLDQFGSTSETPHGSESDLTLFRHTDDPATKRNEFLYRELITETRKTAPEHYGSVT